MPDIQAHLPDGKTVLHFPDGTDPSVIDGVVKQHLSSNIPGSQTQMPTPPVAPQPLAGKMQPMISPSSVKDTAGQIGRGATLGGFSGLGIPETQQPLTDLVKGFASHTPTWKEALDPTAGALTGAYGLGKAEVGSGQEAYQGVKQGDPELASHGIASGLTRALMLKDIAKGTEPAKSGAELKAGVADATYKRGLGVQETLKNASSNIHKAVGDAAQSYIKKVDEKFPQGAIDPTQVMSKVNEAKAELVKTPEKYPRGLAQMLEEEAAPEAVSPYSDVVKQRLAAGKSVNEIRAEFSDPKTGRGLPPEQVNEALKGAGAGGWSADQAKQWRSKIGAAMASSSGPMKSVLATAYDDLSTQMASAAGKADAVKDYADYNNLHKKHLAFLNDPTVKKIMYGDTAKDTLAPLSDPNTMAHIHTLLGDWDKYGIKTEDLANEGSDYGKAQALMAQKRFRWFPGGTLGGAVLGHATGMGYMPGAAIGIGIDRMLSGAGKASKFIENSKVSPFYEAGSGKAASIARGWDEGVPTIPTSKISLKAAENAPEQMPPPMRGGSTGLPPLDKGSLMARLKQSMKPSWAQEDEAAIARAKADMPRMAANVERLRKEKGIVYKDEVPGYDEQGGDLVDPNDYSKGYKKRKGEK